MIDGRTKSPALQNTATSSRSHWLSNLSIRCTPGNGTLAAHSGISHRKDLKTFTSYGGPLNAPKPIMLRFLLAHKARIAHTALKNRTLCFFFRFLLLLSFTSYCFNLSRKYFYLLEFFQEKTEKKKDCLSLLLEKVFFFLNFWLALHSSIKLVY